MATSAARNPTLGLAISLAGSVRRGIIEPVFQADPSQRLATATEAVK